MDAINIVKTFLDYSEYSPERTTFFLGSTEHKLHSICSKLNSFLEFDTSGTLAVIYLRKAFETFLQSMELDVVQLFKNPHILDTEKVLWDMLNSPHVIEIETGMADIINSIVERLSGAKMIGARDVNKEIEVLENVLPGTISDLHHCHKEMYIQGGPLQPIKHLNSHISVFETLTDCLMTLEQCPRDGIYLCYINYNKSADGFFGFFVKNNGNIFSIHDRVLENYPGQHSTARNGRWTESKKTNLFPYDYIFHYTDHDYKGYASTFEIQDEMLDFFNLQAEVYMPIVIAMSVLARTYSEGTIEDMNQVYCNTLIANNAALLNESTLPIPISNSSIATLNRNVHISLSVDEIKTGSCAAEFANSTNYFEHGSLPEENSLFVEMYGDGFELNSTAIVNNVSETGLTIRDKNAADKAEFISTEKHLKLVAYKHAREQLAEHIRNKMCEELANFGGMNAVIKWFNDSVKANKDKILLLMAKKYANAELTEEEQALARLMSIQNTDQWGSSLYVLNPIVDDGRFHHIGCVVNKKIPNIQITWNPKDWTDIERFLGPVPKIVKGWQRDFLRGYGNPLLSVTDAVSFVGTPFERREYEQNKRLWDDQEWENAIWRVRSEDREALEKERELYASYEHSHPFNFSIPVKFSKSGLRTYCKEQGIKITK